MNNELYSKEFECVGYYNPIKTSMFKAWGMECIPEEPRLNRPISPKENWKLLLKGEKPYWIPTDGWAFCDVNVFRPRINIDNVATHIVLDGGDQIEHSKETMGLFDQIWEFCEIAGGAMTHPGTPKVPDITCWKEYIHMPNLNDWDWDASAEENKEFLNNDKLNQLGILAGFWERLMSLMDVDNAAMAMIDEDEKDGVHSFFSEYCDFLCDYVSKVNEHCDIDCVLIHDDWAHQHGPFFSISTAREMLVPYLKRLIDHCHDLGLYFELHCCGKAEKLVPLFVEAGVNVWCLQTMNDLDMLVKQYKETPLVFGITPPSYDTDAAEEQITKLAEEWVEKYVDYHVCVYMTPALILAPPTMKNAIYIASRKALSATV